MKRRSYFRLHQWVGLGVAAVLVLSAITGVLLLFRGQLKTPPPSAPAVEHHLGLDEIVASARAAGDGSPVTDVSIPQSADAAYVVWLDDDVGTKLFLDGRGKVIERRVEAEGFTRWVFLLHTGELLGPVGLVLMLVAGLGLLTLIYSGLAMLWARSQARRRR